MANRFMMTAFGPDRVGIVADVTRILFDNDCNLEDTTMNILADEFTLNLLFTSSRPGIDEILNQECRRLEVEKGISAFVRAVQMRGQVSDRGFKTCVLHIEGLDQSGIVYKTSDFLAASKMNILHLNSSAKASPETGATIYEMDIHVQVPESLSFDQMEEDLGAVADELQVDIQMVR